MMRPVESTVPDCARRAPSSSTRGAASRWRWSPRRRAGTRGQSSWPWSAPWAWARVSSWPRCWLAASWLPGPAPRLGAVYLPPPPVMPLVNLAFW